ncbi:MAG TPA: hypothetical protein VHS33_11495 [Sphingomicrobium sp.]|jgi:hypothetical protein|nr:hypothetical protein [Sphingomicrobium sp.]
MRFRVPVFTCALIIVVAACGKHGPVAKGANAVTFVPEPMNQASRTPEGSPPENEAASPQTADSATVMTIPATLQGRWGLTPADCTSALDQAKGLLVINTEELRFYRSLAVPSNLIQRDSLSLNGDFRFTGEGKAWTRFESLKRSGDKLTRTESDPAASYTYAKC